MLLLHVWKQKVFILLSNGEFSLSYKDVFRLVMNGHSFAMFAIYEEPQARITYISCEQEKPACDIPMHYNF